jgi:hypothetical protein
MSRRNAIDQAAREERVSKTRQCPSCDPCGWKLGSDGTPLDPAVRCSHGAQPPVCRDITEPVHQPELEP